MRYAHPIIESRLGALGTVIVLQCYGLLLAYFFAGAVRYAISTSSLLDVPGNLLVLVVGLTFLGVFMYAEAKLLVDVERYLYESRDVEGWLRECVRPHGILRIVITLASMAFYIALLFGKVTLGFPDLNIYYLLACQAFHPIASHFVGKRIRAALYLTENKYVSAAYQIFGIIMCMIAAAVFYGFGIWMKQDNEPAHWILLMMGTSVAVFGLIGFLLEDIKGRYREVIIEEYE